VARFAKKCTHWEFSKCWAYFASNRGAVVVETGVEFATGFAHVLHVTYIAVDKEYPIVCVAVQSLARIFGYVWYCIVLYCIVLYWLYYHMYTVMTLQ
jgi:hypothetical protein